MADGNTIKKVAILGGGISSLTAALELTEPGYKGKYDITVYQMGWRLGGKGASGRNQQHHDRIEEHGLHLWFGFYDQAFDVMNRCYAENRRPADHPLATVRQAFRPCNFFVLEERVGDQWVTWPLKFPANRKRPGQFEPEPSVMEYLMHMMKFTYSMYRENENLDEIKLPAEPHDQHERLFDELKEHGIPQKRLNGSASEGSRLLMGMYQLISRFFYATSLVFPSGLFMRMMDAFLNWLWKRWEGYVETNIQLRRMWITLDLVMSAVKGILKYDILNKGFAVINDYDFKEFLRLNGAKEITVNSPIVNASYSAFFCGPKLTMEAGTVLHIILRLLFTYKGAFYYRMQGGMGDVVFTPIYEVLKKRGVKFKFFHRVENLEMSADKTHIERIRIARQATLKNEEYQPLIDVKGMECWPSDPLYDQLVEGEQLRQEKINLESFWTPWKDIEHFDLQMGKDYDDIILGISIGALPHICADIIREKPAWQDMIEHVKAIPTQALQLWLKPELAELGWKYAHQEHPFLSTYEDPFDTWADMTDVIEKESWEGELVPNKVAYFCNNMPDVEFEPPTNHDFPGRQKERVRQNAISFLKKHTQYLFPKALCEEAGEFKWSLLVDPDNTTGEDRINSQYFRANVDPSERYVLALKGSSRYRLKAHESGFENLFLTGDWIDNELNSLNAGFIEGSVAAGKRAAYAVSRYPIAENGQPQPNLLQKFIRFLSLKRKRVKSRHSTA